MKHHPILTILTAVSSFEEALLTTFASIKSDLSNKKIRWIIKSCDPASEQQLSNFEGFQDSVFFIAEKDSSLYEALNVGLKLVSTKYFLVLGSGDYLFPGAIDFINDKISRNADYDGFMFPVDYEDYIYPTVLDSIHFRMPCSHQGTVLDVQKALSIGGFDTRYKYASDYDLISRYYIKFRKILTLNHPIGHNAPGGISDINKFQTVLELYSIAHKHWNFKYKDYDFNEVAIHNLFLTNEKIKTKKIKKQKGESMQTPSEIRQEIFSYLLNIENERRKEEESKFKEINSVVNEISKALDIAHEDFLNLKKEIDILKSEKSKVEQSYNQDVPQKNIYLNDKNLEIQSVDKQALKITESLEPLFGTNEKLKSLFGFTQKKA